MKLQNLVFVGIALFIFFGMKKPTSSPPNFPDITGEDRGGNINNW